MDSLYELHKICRICLKSDLLVSFFAHLPAFLVPPIEMIKKLQLFKFQADENLPTSLCQSCLYRLYDAYNLKLQAEASEKRLQNFLRPNDSFNINNSLNNQDSCSYTNNTITQNITTKDANANNTIYANICDMFERNIAQSSEDDNTGGIQPSAEQLNDVEIDVSSLTRSEPDDSCLSEVFVGENVDQMFEIKDNFSLSMQNKYTAKPLQLPDKCQRCGGELILEEYTEEREEEYPNKMILQCKFCSQYPAKSNKAPQSEWINNAGARRFQCEICANFFTTSSNLKAHKQTHLERRDFSCNLCKSSFKSARELRRHEPVHKNIKDIICAICQKAFTKPNYLSAHMSAVHRGVRRHKCMECGKVFGNRSNLLCHIRTHTGEKPFKCKYCTWKFSQSSALARHMKKKHSKSKNDEINANEKNDINSIIDNTTINNVNLTPRQQHTASSLSSVEQQRQQHHETNFNYLRSLNTHTTTTVQINNNKLTEIDNINSIQTTTRSTTMPVFENISDFSTN